MEYQLNEQQKYLLALCKYGADYMTRQPGVIIKIYVLRLFNKSIASIAQIKQAMPKLDTDTVTSENVETIIWFLGFISNSYRPMLGALQNIGLGEYVELYNSHGDVVKDFVDDEVLSIAKVCSNAENMKNLALRLGVMFGLAKKEGK